MKKTGWLIFSFYVLTGFLLVAMTRHEASFVGFTEFDERSPRLELRLACNQQPDAEACMRATWDGVQP